MWTNFMKYSFILGIFLLAIQSFAAEVTLEQLRKQVLDENVDIKIQYEKYYQSQRNVGVALGQFLPNASINLININATLAVLQSVVPTPSDWFVYQSSQELSIAEKFTTESIKLNILEGLTVNFLNIKHQEELLLSMKNQEEFLKGVYEEVVKKEELGMATPNDVFTARRNLLQHRQDIFSLKTLMGAEKQSLLIALNRTPDEELTLGALPEVNLDVIPGNSDEGIQLAIKNSPELESNKFQAQAARFMVSSKRWSFISFNGIGFDYAANLSIEKSRARVIELQREQIVLKIKNQVHTAYDDLAILDQRIELQSQVAASSKDMDVRNTELYENEMIPLSKYLESKNALAGEERTLVRLKMQKLVKLAHLKRLLGLDASLGKFDEQRYGALTLSTTEKQVRRGTNVLMKVDGPKEVLEDILSVTYSIPEVLEYTTEIGDHDFAFEFRFRISGEYELMARIRLVSGEEIVKTQKIIIK